MNDEDKKRFARYRKGYIEPENEDEKEEPINNNNNKIGFVEKIDINQDDLVSKVLQEFEAKNRTEDKKIENKKK